MGLSRLLVARKQGKFNCQTKMGISFSSLSSLLVTGFSPLHGLGAVHDGHHARHYGFTSRHIFLRTLHCLRLTKSRQQLIYECGGWRGNVVLCRVPEIIFKTYIALHISALRWPVDTPT